MPKNTKKNITPEVSAETDKTPKPFPFVESAPKAAGELHQLFAATTMDKEIEQPNATLTISMEEQPVKIAAEIPEDTAQDEAANLYPDYKTWLQTQSDNCLPPNYAPYDSAAKIDWKAQIPDEFIVFNDEALDKDGVVLKDMSDEERAEYKQTCPDYHKLVLIAGWEHVARLRGIKAKKVRTVVSDTQRSVVECSLEFTPNDENPYGLSWESVSEANTENVKGKTFQQHLASIASNRAFSHAVRTALGIKMLGRDELPLNSDTNTKVVKQKDLDEAANPNHNPFGGKSKETKGGGDVIDMLKEKIEKRAESRVPPISYEKQAKATLKHVNEKYQRNYKSIDDIAPIDALKVIAEFTKKETEEE